MKEFLDYVLMLPWVPPLGWTLVHFLWQGGVIGIVAAVIFRASREAKPQVRYVVGIGALAACICAPVVTFLILAEPFSGHAPKIVMLGNAKPEVIESRRPDVVVIGAERKDGKTMPSPQATASSEVRVAAKVERAIASWEMLTYAVRGVVPGWFFGVCVLALRLAVSWMRVQVWRRRAAAAEADWLDEAMRGLMVRLGMQVNVPVLISAKIPGPLTLGFLKPAILLPVRILTGLTRDQVEAILAHELAHIRRHDYLVNLLQSVVEVVLFYHPVVWWLNKQVRAAREECCDEVAAEMCGNKAEYVKALTALAELDLAIEPALGARGGEFLSRMHRLLGRREPEVTLAGNSAWLLCVVVAILVAGGILFSARLMAAERTPVSNSKQAPKGVVVDETGVAMKDAEVILYRWKNIWGLGNAVVERTHTDAAGRYALKSALDFETPNGTSDTDHYALFAIMPGKAPAWWVIVGGTPDQGDYTLTVTKPVQQSYQVVDKEGKPLAGVRIWLRYAAQQRDKEPFFPHGFLVPDDLGLASVVSDEQGEATLTNLPDTTYSIAASLDGYETNLSCTTPREGMPKFVMKRSSVLEGRVTDAQGVAVEGATVWLFPKFKWHQFFLTKTDRDGRYRVEGIWSDGDTPDWGKYEVGVRDVNFAVKTKEVTFRPAERIAGFDFQVERGVLLRGILTDSKTGAPVAGGRVDVNSGSGRRGLFSDVNGNFQCRVVPGDITIFVTSPPGGHYITRDVESRSMVRTQAFGAEMKVSVLSGPLGKLGRLEGMVVTEDGQPARFVQGGVVVLGPLTESSPYYQAQGFYTNKEGAFVSDNVPVGRQIVVTATGSDGKSAGLEHADMTVSGLKLPEPVKLTKTADVQISLVDGSGRPLVNCAVTVIPMVDGKMVYLWQKKLKTDKDGGVKISGVMRGIDYRFEMEGKRYSDVTVPLLPASGSSPSQLMITDDLHVRLVGADGQSMSIGSFKEYFVNIDLNGEKSKWTNGRLKILRREGNEVVVSREFFVLGKAGQKVEAKIETSDGNLVNAEGDIPQMASEALIFKAVGTVVKDEYQWDTSIANVGPREIAGRVTDDEGRPIAGAKVEDAATKENWYFEPGKSDAEGVFRVSLKEEREPSYIVITKDGYASLYLADYPVGKGFSVRLHNTTRLQGHLGDGVTGKVSIRLERNMPTKREQRGFEVRDVPLMTETKEDGSYDFPVEPAKYRYQLRSEDGRFARGEIVIKEGETAAFPGELQKGGSVTLQFIDCQTAQPVSGIEVFIAQRLDAYVRGNLPDSKRTSDAEGMATWQNLMPGETEFDAWRMFFSRWPGNSQLPYTRWWREDDPVKWRRIDMQKGPPRQGDGTQPIYVDVGPQMKMVKVFVEKGVKVSGKVVGPDGKPAERIQIGVVPNQGMRATLTGDSKFTMTTDGEGRFSGYIPAGNGVVYNLCAYAWPNNEGNLANAVSELFSSKPGDEFTFDLQMTKGAWVTGKVVDKEGHPVAGIEVQAMNKDLHDSAYADKLTETDEEGNFRLGPLRTGRYDIFPDTMKGINIASGRDSMMVMVADGDEKAIGSIEFSRKDK